MAEPNNNPPTVFTPAELINDPKGCAERLSTERGISLEEATQAVEQYRDQLMRHHTRNVADSTGGGGIPREEMGSSAFSSSPDDRLSLAEIQTFSMNEKAMVDRATFAFNMLNRAHRDQMVLDPEVINAANAILVAYLGPHAEE